MWIQNTSTGQTVELQLDWMDEPVTFNDQQTAQVPAAVGERLVEELDAIEPYESDTS